MKQTHKTAFRQEMYHARECYSAGDLDKAFWHLERAHILGQRYFTLHMLTHCWMLRIGVRRSDAREIPGQILRMIAVVPGYLFGWVPKGNTGGANVSALQPMPIPDDLEVHLVDFSVRRDVIVRLPIWMIIATLIAMVVRADRLQAAEAAALEREWEVGAVEPVGDFGATQSLEITPLVNWHASSPEFKTEPGVSYLIKTDDNTILFDLGYNRFDEAPSPLQHNMAQLGISVSDIDAVFLSHAHRDHLGGTKWEKTRSFGLGSDQRNLQDKRLFAPVALTYPRATVEVLSSPQTLLPGVATTGPIPRRLFLGRIDEQALVINVAGKGLVVIVGCGHQTTPKLLQRLEEAFDQPLYGIVGDLHYPVPNGRFRVMGIDVQHRLASGDGIFAPLTWDHVAIEIAVLEQQIEFLTLGGHDTSDDILDLVAEAFGERFQKAEVGQTIVISSPS